jgi:hypothetical protein
MKPVVLPTTCVSAEEAATGCVLRVHHFRPRTTGPAFPIAVLLCGPHRRAFTLYPPGHEPYGRVAYAPVGPSGEPLVVADTPAAEKAAAPKPTFDAEEERRPAVVAGLNFEGTLFAAAVDASRGYAWARDDDPEDRGPDFDTQVARLSRASAWLGLNPRPEDKLGEQIARALDVPRLTLHDAADEYGRASGLAQRGRVVVSVLERLRPDRCLLDRLIAAGVHAGVFATVHRFEPGATRAAPRGHVFRPAGTAPS